MTDLVVEALGKRYEREDGTETEALREVSFEVEPGEFVAVVGPSGCGKSTLVRLVGGLDSPTSGSIRLDGDPVTGPGPERGVVFQEHHLFPWLSVRENVAFGLVERGIPEPRRSRRVEEVLDLVGLPDAGEAYPREISGGMKRRVGLARALAVDPELLLMDEPFASVDAQTRRRLQSELLEIWAETRKTVLFVTHDIEEAVVLADRVLVMADDPGRIHDRVEPGTLRPRNRSDPGVVETVDRVFELVGVQ
jgi:NitT/TauT family transport system ATP-binding protein